MPESSDRNRLLWMIIVALALGAISLWASTQLAWDSSGAGEEAAERPAALGPLALLALAGIAGLIATGGWARRVLCGVLCIAGIAAIVVAVMGWFLATIPQLGPVVATLGGALVLGAGVAGIRAADRLPRMGGRYAAGTRRQASSDPDADLWKALSEGRDPTTRE